ncbi:hypothetical protein [Helicobacter hepaticus]|jgi:hypothetical protein|uniref:Uncharacterized protein n=1 Tax=Helicobacter hepaticus (strain ATCC 51449 / 3B1) TaxID=235279 RepID=Q7VIQ1_HELHP|nr:hypothetical protein [Helicobacter hepaticus]AAP77150.1 hypothetical protein HH_0553 [Helicobacter hepaticus ATCC 51449]
MSQQEFLDEIVINFCKKLDKFSAQYGLKTEEFITFGVFDNLLFTFEHYLEQEEDCISLDVSFRVKSIKSDEILCASLEIDEPDLDFKILNEYGVRSFPFSFKSMEFSNMQELQEFALDDMPSDSYHNFLSAYKESIESLLEAFKIDTSSTIQGLYDFIYKYENNKDVFWKDRTLMQILLLIELNQKEQALKILKNDPRTNEERKISIEYDNEEVEIFDILIYSLENNII